jgi:hypothetical protein
MMSSKEGMRLFRSIVVQTAACSTSWTDTLSVEGVLAGQCPGPRDTALCLDI